LKISAFAGKGGEISAAIETGRFSTATAFITMKDLAQFRQYVQSSIKALETLKAP
jgi:hypothetical protein